MTARLNAIGIIVSDMAASVAFYRQLGVDFPEGAEAESNTEAKLQGGIRLMLDTEETVRSYQPDWQPPRGQARQSLVVECDTPPQVDSLYERLTTSGSPGKVAPWDAPWGQRHAVVLDPDGNAVDLHAPLP